MECPHRENHDGFTLVEISIVMIIIGLLIGGTFGGMKLVENMQVNKTVQDLKAIESAALTFKDTYGRLPGDIRNPSTRLRNCTVAPCATSGDGDKRISPTRNAVDWRAAMDPTYERYTFWSHLQAADVLANGTQNSLDMTFGVGQPESPIGGGMRLTEYTGVGWICSTLYDNAIILLVGHPTNATTDVDSINTIPCPKLESVDRKIDDGIQFRGKVVSVGCEAAATCANGYDRPDSTGFMWYDAKF